MKRRLFGFVGLLTLAILNASLAVAQDQTLSSAAGDKWVITAKAGGVNLVEGTVNVARKDGRAGLLVKGDAVDVGDRISTGANGRTEILLNPGSYLRVAENSAFEFATTSLDDLQIKVERGSAILEVFATEDFKVSVNTPKEEYGLIKTGIYRIDVAADGNARLEVWKGKAEVGESTVKGGKVASSLDGQVAVAKFDRDERDAFETWSRDRAKELAKGTNELRDRTLRTSLMRSFLGGRWNMYDSFGLWVYNARAGRYCFLPFGYGWSSPYGFGFGSDIWYYRLPSVVYYPPSNPGPVTGRSPQTPPPTGSTPTTSNRPRRDRGGERQGGVFARRPAFEAIQPRTSGGVDSDGGGSAPDTRSRGSRGSSPVFAPQRTESAPASAPARSRDSGGGSRIFNRKEQP